MDDLLVALGVALSFVFGWNNSSLLIGNVRGAGSLSYKLIVTVAVVGLLLGALAEGSKMQGSLAGSLAPSATTAALLATAGVSLFLTVAMTLLDLPVSFSMVMVGAFIGATLASAISLNVGRAGDVIAFWFVAPLGTAVLTYAIYGAVRKAVSNLGILAVDTLNRAGSFVSAFAVSYTLGANNIGMFFGSVGGVRPGTQLAVIALLALAAVLGVLLLGKNSLGGTVGDRMLALSPQAVVSAFVASSVLVWIGTQLALPVSITQCLLGGMLGAAFSRHVAIVNTKLVRETLSLWVVAPVMGLVLAFVVTLYL
jgi:inorganic phosphate transporter, PiT family